METRTKGIILLILGLCLSLIAIVLQLIDGFTVSFSCGAISGLLLAFVGWGFLKKKEE